MATRLTDTPVNRRSRTPGGIQSSTRTPGAPGSQRGVRTVPRPAAPGRATGRTGAPPRPARPAARPVTPPRPAPPRPGVTSQPARTIPPVRTAPPVRTKPPARTAPAAPRPDQASARRRRMPFLLLVVGLLAGALVGMLVISTTLAAGSFRISTLQKQNQALAKQQQELQQQVSQDQAPSVIAQRAAQLGMQPVKQLEFLNVKTGKVSSNEATGATAHIQVPGYTP
jgi:hypothetical protein